MRRPVAAVAFPNPGYSSIKPFAIILSITLLGAATAAHADQMIKAGEWVVTDVINDKGPGEPTKICRPGDRTIEEIFTRVLAKPGTTCSKKEFNSNGNTVTFALSCTISGVQVTMRGTQTWTGADAYHSDYYTHYEGVPGMRDIARSSDAKRLGPCQPGDVMQEN